MPNFSQRSIGHFNRLHPILQKLHFEAIKIIDYSLIDSYRNNIKQQGYFDLGTSLARAGESPHNYFPALASDQIPYPLINNDWDDKKQFARLIGVFQTVAFYFSLPIEFGYDWGWDMPHIQLINWRSYV